VLIRCFYDGRGSEVRPPQGLRPLFPLVFCPFGEGARQTHAAALLHDHYTSRTCSTSAAAAASPPRWRRPPWVSGARASSVWTCPGRSERQSEGAARAGGDQVSQTPGHHRCFGPRGSVTDRSYFGCEVALKFSRERARAIQISLDIIIEGGAGRVATI